MQKVEIGNATLYLGDCLEIIPTITDPITAVVSDPPYGTEDIAGGYRRSQAAGTGEILNIANDRSLDCCFAAIDAIAKRFNNFRMIVFYSPRVVLDFYARAAAARLPFSGELVWDKKMPGLGYGALRYQHEGIAMFDFGMPPEMGEALSVLTHVRKPELHPHQKPTLLMQQLCTIANGEYVLDPFMGSGSTGVAALTEHRRFIGIEIDPKHFDTACKRIEEQSKLETLF